MCVRYFGVCASARFQVTAEIVKSCKCHCIHGSLNGLSTCQNYGVLVIGPEFVYAMQLDLHPKGKKR